MEKEEFNLSKKIFIQGDKTLYYRIEVEDIKEFIKRLKEAKIDYTTSRRRWLYKIIDKLAGGDLI